VGRDREKLAKFKLSWQDTPFIDSVKVHLWDELSALVSETQLLVNATPVGMSPHIDRSPVEETILKQLPESAIAYDLIYTPSPTRFLQLAKNCGAMAIDGSEMLVQQGAAALQLWLQQPVPANIMRQTLLANLH
jgi:shikimate dehydrogenase